MRGNKRGQLAIFIIIAVVIVASVLAIFLFPRINLSASEVNPSSFLIGCIESEMAEIKNVLSKQGGYSSPDSFTLYQGDKIQYLCYTSNSYEPCTVQQPLLVRHVEREMESYLSPIARECTRNLKDQYEKRGYSVRSEEGEIDVKIVHKKINVEFLSPMTITKEGTQSFDKFSISIDSEWYGLLTTAMSIIQFESTLGDSEISLYMQYYPDLRIEKIKRNDDTIYKLSNVVTKEDFVFATRSLVWPQGVS